MKKLLLLISGCFLLTNVTMAQCGLFTDGFNSGSYSGSWTVAGSYTFTTTTSSPAVGSHCVSNTGSSGHMGGPYASFTPGQPTDISWYAKATSLSSANTYFVVGDANTSSNYGICFAYFNSANQLRFYANSSNAVTLPITTNTWYFIEMRNINYTTKTFDIYVDNVLLQANFPFRSTSSNDVSRVYLYNLGSLTGYYDEIAIGGSPITLTAGSTMPTCPGTTDGAASITPTGGTPAYSYLWSTGDTSSNISGLGAGTYTVVVSDSAGCVDSSSVTLTDPAAISSALTLAEPDCNGNTNGSISVAASGGTGSSYTYLWNTGDTTAMLSGVGAGTYNVVITDSNGCTHSDTAMLSEPLQLLANTNAQTPTCVGDTNGMISTSVSGGTPGYLYAWSTGASTTAISGLVAGAYAVTVTDTNGCQVSDTIQLSDPAAVTAGLSATDISCNGQNDGMIMATGGGGTPGYTYLWSNGDTTNSISGLGAGNYSVMVTDANGCTTSDTAAIVEPTAIAGSASIVDEINGNGNGSIDLTATGGTPPYSYSWSNGATTEDLSGISAGTYTVTVTDGNGCTYVDSFVVDMIVGIANPGQGPEVTLFPNPAENLLNIQLEGAEQMLTLEIVAMDGRVLKALRSEGNAARNEQFNVADLSAGVYLLRISSESGTAFVRWTKQ